MGTEILILCDKVKKFFCLKSCDKVWIVRKVKLIRDGYCFEFDSCMCLNEMVWVLKLNALGGACGNQSSGIPLV